MLRQVFSEPSREGLIDFRSIQRYQQGRGMCYVYGAVNKTTKAHKPFVTLYIRDFNGIAIPCYVFDIRSPLLAGREVNNIINSIVMLEWEENYLAGRGLTLIASKVEKVEESSISANILTLFRGEVQNLDDKYNYLVDFFVKTLRVKFDIPLRVRTNSFMDYSNGNIGGLLEHYYKMSKVMETYEYLGTSKYRQLVATFALFIMAHSLYVKAEKDGAVDITLASSLTSNIERLNHALKASPGVLELVHIFFGYEPKDIYVRTVKNISDHITRVAKEFATYDTVPLEQEGDAGYGKIRRYVIEED